MIHSEGSEDPYIYAYNILVSLNRMLSEDYPDTIEEVCDSNIILSDENLEQYNLACEGIEIVTLDRWDETHGSTEYITDWSSLNETDK